MDFSILVCVEVVGVKVSAGRLLTPSLSPSSPIHCRLILGTFSSVGVKGFRSPNLTYFSFLRFLFPHLTSNNFWCLLKKVESLKFYALQSFLEKDTDFTCVIPRTDLDKRFLSEFLFPLSITVKPITPGLIDAAGAGFDCLDWARPASWRGSAGSLHLVAPRPRCVLGGWAVTSQCLPNWKLSVLARFQYCCLLRTGYSSAPRHFKKTSSCSWNLCSSWINTDSPNDIVVFLALGECVL